MNATEFLRTVWPTQGPYCIARGMYPSKRTPGKLTMYHDEVHTPQEGARVGAQYTMVKDIYFLIHSLKPETITISNAGHRIVAREAANTRWVRCFYIDIDCGWNFKKNKMNEYPTKAAGGRALAAFCLAIGLPLPMVVSSGGGLHCYWLLTDDMDSELEWWPIAKLFVLVLAHYDLDVDTSATADRARVLRLVGTFNHKNPDPSIRPKVKVLREQPERISNAEFVAIIQAAADALPDIEVQQLRDLPPGEKPTPLEVATVCPTFRRMLEEASFGSGKAWMLTNTIAVHTTGGSKFAHRVARVHHTYGDGSETQNSLDRIVEKKNIGPPTCKKLQELYPDNSPCLTCAYRGQPQSSPVVFARRLPKTALPDGIPLPQLPYMRTKRGVEIQPPANAAGVQPPNRVICEYDLHPTLMIDELATESKAVVWRAVLPMRSDASIKMPIDAYNDPNKMITLLSNNGVIVHASNAKAMGGYMSHYIKILQEAQLEQKQVDHFGWDEARKKFYWGHEAISATGTTKAILSQNLLNLADQMHSSGTREGQVQALQFYNHPEYMAQKFLVCSGLAAPLLYMTGLFGLLTGIVGPSGASKSTGLEAVGSHWGRGSRYMINAGETDSTANGRAGRIKMSSNLPFCLDETTLMPADQMKSMIMSITGAQPGKVGQRQDGSEKRIVDNLKSTIVLCTSNNSIHALLSSMNLAGDAGSMRLFEMLVERQTVHTKAEADAFIRAIREHYGHTGPAFVRALLRIGLDVVQARVIKVMAHIERVARMPQQERFWSANAAAALVALEIAVEEGLLFYDVNEMFSWLVHTQIPYMRSVVSSTYLSPLDMMQNYLGHIAGNTLVVGMVQSFGREKEITPLRAPIGALKARLEVGERVYVDKQDFRAYCDERRLPFNRIISTLEAEGVLSRTKMSLGRYVEAYGMAGQTHTLCIDLKHEAVSGLAPVTDDTGKVVVAFPKREG